MQLKSNDILALSDTGAVVTFGGVTSSIQDHIINAQKPGYTGWEVRPTTSFDLCVLKPFKALKIGNLYLPMSYLYDFHQALWLQYLKKNVHLIETLAQYDAFEHYVLHQFMVTEQGELYAPPFRGQRLIRNIQPFLNILNQRQRLIYVQEPLNESFTPLIVQVVNGEGRIQGTTAYELGCEDPQFFRSYKAHLVTLREKAFGTQQWIPCESFVVACLYVQRRYQDTINLDALTALLIQLKEEAKKKKWPIAIPIGMGIELSMDTWERDVLPVVIDVFSDYPVYLYQPYQKR